MKPLRAGLYGLAASAALLDGDYGDAEERCRRIQAEQEAKNIGVVIGLAAGVATALVQDGPSAEKSQIEEAQQQTM